MMLDLGFSIPNAVVEGAAPRGAAKCRQRHEAGSAPVKGWTFAGSDGAEPSKDGCAYE